MAGACVFGRARFPAPGALTTADYLFRAFGLFICCGEWSTTHIERATVRYDDMDERKNRPGKRWDGEGGEAARRARTRNEVVLNDVVSRGIVAGSQQTNDTPRNVTSELWRA